MLKKLNSSASVLMIGAHPDDEDTALLAYLARGESARTAYLSLTRGDGGQNIIGPELGEALGLIRTEELLQARKLDGAEQYFTRAYDYGFSKTLAEAKQKWDEKIVLCDAVRVIRNFRPLLVVAQFSGTPADGHGQHQFAGYIAPIAINAAADSSQCPSTGPAWKVLKVYVRHRGPGDPRLRVNSGRFDPVLGRSYFEIAMEARSQHKSQEQGVLELRGAQFSSMNPVGSEVLSKGVFDGLDVSIGGAASSIGIDGNAKLALDEMQKFAGAAMSELSVLSPENIVPYLARGYTAAARGASVSTFPSAKEFFELKRKLFAEAITLAAGVQLDALADRETVAPGEKLFVGARAFTPNEAVKAKSLSIRGPESWAITQAEVPKTNSPAYLTREPGDSAAYFDLTVPASWQPTQPYWLADPRDGDLFRWDPGRTESHTFPFAEREARLFAVLEAAGTEIVVERPIEYRFADDVRGEIRRNVDIVPIVSVEVDPTMLIIPSSQKTQTARVSLTVTNHSSKPVTGTVSLDIQAKPEWRQSAPRAAFSLTRSGEKAVFPFDVTIPAGSKPGNYQILGTAMVGGMAANSTMRTVAYPHIQTHRYYRRAEVAARIIDVKIEPVKVGYVAGSGDRVPEAIRQMGFDLEMISESELAYGDLSRFDAIVVGIRAFQVRLDVVANNGRLLDFAREGGTLIVQYQLPGYAQQRLMPFPTQMGPRVSDENAPVKILVPEHPIFNSPNKITQADFEGWVQERNLYNFSGFGPEYTGLLESHDTGEAENAGGLVIARVGKGTYIYASYSFFRQLPAGVGGAYRLFANIVSSSSRAKRK